MRCKVLKSFPYAHDGIKVEDLPEGENRDIRDELVPGLIAEGFVERAPATVDPGVTEAERIAREKAEAEAKAAALAARGAVVIPDEMPTKLDELRELAVQLTDEPVKSKDDALKAIEAEKARRAASPL